MYVPTAVLSRCCNSTSNELLPCLRVDWIFIADTTVGEKIHVIYFGQLRGMETPLVFMSKPGMPTQLLTVNLTLAKAPFKQPEETKTRFSLSYCRIQIVESISSLTQPSKSMRPTMISSSPPELRGQSLLAVHYSRFNGCGRANFQTNLHVIIYQYQSIHRI